MRPLLLLTINWKFAVDFFDRGLHTRTAVARLLLRQLGFLVKLAVHKTVHDYGHISVTRTSKCTRCCDTDSRFVSRKAILRSGSQRSTLWGQLMWTYRFPSDWALKSKNRKSHTVRVCRARSPLHGYAISWQGLLFSGKEVKGEGQASKAQIRNASSAEWARMHV